MPRRFNFEMVQYHQKVLELDPIAYWIQDEKVGTVAYDWVRRSQGSDQDGAYTGVTLGEPGIGDGRTSPFFDGVNDFNDIFTPTFQGRFALANHGAPGAVSEGTVMVWARVANSGVWTDGSVRRIINLYASALDLVEIQLPAGVNTLRFRYRAGGVAEVVSVTTSTTDWFCGALTWSASADEVRAYLNGVQQGATQVGLGVWAGNLLNNRTNIGCNNTVGPTEVWHGYTAHGAVWDRALTPQELS